MNWRLNKAAFKGRLFKLLFGRKITIGTNFSCDTFPDVFITQKGKLTIGDNVLLRRNVEIRVHQNAEINIGSDVRVDRGVRLLATNQAKLDIDTGTRIGLYSVFNGGDSIMIGKKCLISGFVYLQTSMHRYKGTGEIQNQGFDHARIVLKDDVWIGAHAVILPNTVLGEGSIVGSNAVVNSSVEKNTIVGGVPAKILKSRNKSK